MDVRLAAVMTGLPLVQRFTARGTQRMLERGEVRLYLAGAVLFKQGDAIRRHLSCLCFTAKSRYSSNATVIIWCWSTSARGTILGELSVLCGAARAASVRPCEAATVLQWNAPVVRNMLLRHPLLSDRISTESLRALVEKVRLLIDSMARLSRSTDKPNE